MALQEAPAMVLGKDPVKMPLVELRARSVTTGGIKPAGEFALQGYAPANEAMGAFPEGDVSDAMAADAAELMFTDL